MSGLGADFLGLIAYKPNIYVKKSTCFIYHHVKVRFSNFGLIWALVVTTLCNSPHIQNIWCILAWHVCCSVQTKPFCQKSFGDVLHYHVKLRFSQFWAHLSVCGNHTIRFPLNTHKYVYLTRPLATPRISRNDWFDWCGIPLNRIFVQVSVACVGSALFSLSVCVSHSTFVAFTQDWKNIMKSFLIKPQT